MAETEGKKKEKLKDKLNSKLEKEHVIKFSWKGVAKIAAIIAAIPAAFVLGKSMSDKCNEALLEGDYGATPELPGKTEGGVIETTATDEEVVYEEF